MKLIYTAVVLGVLFHWICGKHKGLAHGWPLADHRRPMKSDMKLFLPSSIDTTAKVSAPQINPPILPLEYGSEGPPRDTTGRDISDQNFDFLQSVPSDQQGAFLLSNLKIFPDRDGPDDRGRQIPGSFFKEMQSELSAPQERFGNAVGKTSKTEMDGAPFFAVLPNPEQQPDNMRDYALLDEADDQKPIPTMPPIIALPPIPLKENRITKIPVMTATIEDVLLPTTVTIPKSTTAMGKRQQVSTSRPKSTSSRTSTSQKATNRADQSSEKQAKSKRVTRKPKVQNNTKRPPIRARAGTDVPKQHREHKRSPPQALSYIPAFRRRQTIPNPFNNAPNGGFENPGDSRFGNIPAVQNNPYGPVNNRKSTERTAFQNVPYDNAFNSGDPRPPFAFNNNNPSVLYGNNPSVLNRNNPSGLYGNNPSVLNGNNPSVLYGNNPPLGYGSPVLGFNDRVSGYNVPLLGHNRFSVTAPPLQNTFLPYGGGNQIPAFIGGSLGVGLPSFALSYPIPAFTTPIFPSYLSGFATPGTFQQFPLQNQGIVQAPYYNPYPAVNPLFSAQGYPFGNPGFEVNPYDIREFLYDDGLRRKNNTDSYRSAESYEIDSLNGFNRSPKPPRRKNANPVLHPTINGLGAGMPGRTPIGQSISGLLPPATLYPAMMPNPSIPFGMPKHLTSMIPRRPPVKTGFSNRFPYIQTGQFYNPEEYFEDYYDDLDFPDQAKRPDFDDDDDFIFQQEPKKTDFLDGVNKQPDKSNSGSSTFKMQTDKTGSSQPNPGSDSIAIEEDAQQFPTMSSVDTSTEKPIIFKAAEVKDSEKEKTATRDSLQQEIPQKNETNKAALTDEHKTDKNKRENGTTPLPQMPAQDRFSTVDSPYESLYYHGNSRHSENPTMLAYFYPRQVSPKNVASQPRLNYHGISINDPQIWKYFKTNKDTLVTESPAPKTKRTRKPKPSSAKKCTDLFGNTASCKTTKSKRKPKSKTNHKQDLKLPYEVLNGGLFLNFGENVPQQYPEGTQLFYNSPHQYHDSPQILHFNEPQQNDFNAQPHPIFTEPPPQNFNLGPQYPLPPPNTVPLSHVEHTLLSQSFQGGWRPIAGPPRQARRSRPTYNRQHFQFQPPAISPHGHPALRKGFRFPQSPLV